MTYLLLVAGLVGLFFGGEFLVKGAVGIARRFGLSPLVIGLTVVGFGTSSPELLVSLQAAFAGSPAIALGNVVGSNIANVLLILGLTAAIAPVGLAFGRLRRDLAVMVGATVALWLAILGGTLARPEAAALAVALVIYLWVAIRGTGAPETAGGEVGGDTGTGAGETPTEGPAPALGRSVLVTLAGFVVLLVSARLLVTSATTIARDLGFSEAVIGLTVVAVGTSLPELATSVVAAMRRQGDIAVGNVLGSNIFNILCILGITGMIAPMQADARFATLDLPIALGVALLVVAASLALGRLGRLAGLGFLGGYAAYVVSMATA
ncbi:calcium/sodium antiporter [Frigidibacter sp. MR17.24]|uniref:calcium/sodium antiporter n=1 Tax=Frigidibacter sp. MR17.24 TaxID=3127345 RepID=UPI003012A1D0